MNPVHASVAPLTDTDTTLYEAPAANRARVWLFGAERAGGTPNYRVAVVPSGDTLDSKHYVVYEAAFLANGTVEHGPFYLSAGDKVVVRASDANTSFSANGYEDDAS